MLEVIIMYIGSRNGIYGDGCKIDKKETKTALQLRTTWSDQLILTLLKTYVLVFKTHLCLLLVSGWVSLFEIKQNLVDSFVSDLLIVSLFYV